MIGEHAAVPPNQLRALIRLPIGTHLPSRLGKRFAHDLLRRLAHGRVAAIRRATFANGELPDHIPAQLRHIIPGLKTAFVQPLLKIQIDRLGNLRVIPGLVCRIGQTAPAGFS